MAAYSLHQNLTPLGNYLHRMKAKLGPKAAAMATAHKTAVIFCTMVKNQVEYDETIWDARDAQSEKSLQSKLKRQAKQLGWGARMRMAWSRRPTTCGVDQAPPTTRPSPRDPRTPLSAARSVAGHCQDSLATKHVSRFLLQTPSQSAMYALRCLLEVPGATLGQHTENQTQALQRVPQTHGRFLPNAVVLPAGWSLGSANSRFPHLFDFRVQ